MCMAAARERSLRMAAARALDVSSPTAEANGFPLICLACSFIFLHYSHGISPMIGLSWRVRAGR